MPLISIPLYFSVELFVRANAHAAEVLGATLADLKRPAAELLHVVRALAANKPDGAVTRREVREASGLPTIA